jgi:exodeoxyribonuclease VII large subunit
MIDQPISVSELTYAIKGLLETGIGQVSVIGEISNYKHHSSGHRYFTLKDADAQISGVMWKTRQLKFVPADGMRVVVHGRLSVFAPQGKYQIDCMSMQPEGVGDLHRAFEQLREKLLNLGYFDSARKRPLPRPVRRVGIATSATGAVIRDMLTTLRRRFPAMEVVFRPTIVQGGEQASRDIACAIDDLNAEGVDVVIIGRGGGSLEDLWCFNTQIVADAILGSHAPVISAVGHETDVTISDFVADLRAPTPTAAAELITPVTMQDLIEGIDELRRRMISDVESTVINLRQMALAFVDGRAARRLTERVHQRSQRIDDLTTRASRAVLQNVQLRRMHIDHTVALLSSLHPLAPLQRGYAVLERDGRVINAGVLLSPGEVIDIRRQHDVVRATVNETHSTDNNTGS